MTEAEDKVMSAKEREQLLEAGKGREQMVLQSLQEASPETSSF